MKAKPVEIELKVDSSKRTILKEDGGKREMIVVTLPKKGVKEGVEFVK